MEVVKRLICKLAFQKRFQKSSLWTSEDAQHVSTMESGLDSSIGIVEGMFSVFPDFMVKIQNPSIHDPRLEEFTIYCMEDLMDRDSYEFLLCPIRPLRK